VSAGAPSPWADAVLAARLLAQDPARIGGIVLRGRPGPVRDRWLAMLRVMLPPSRPLRRVPAHAAPGRLLGGLDLAATLKAGRPLAERGILADAHGGVLVLAMAERMPAATAALLAAALDDGAVALQRDGLEARLPTRFAIVALDEGIEPEERVADALADRIAIHLDLDTVTEMEPVDAGAPVSAGAMPVAEDGVVEALCETAAALGIVSVRAPLLALAVARAHAVLAGGDRVGDRDAAAAARLVLAPRATCLPAPAPAPAAEQPPPPPADETEETGAAALGDVLLAAARAALPPGLLARLGGTGAQPRRADPGGGAGAQQAAQRGGRPCGARAGDPQRGARLDLIETLRAAAPWQRLRRRDGDGPRVAVRREDFRIVRHRRRTGTAAIFAVDASGSAALHRLAEAKGAVELLLADCYVRRDHAALIAFRGAGAEILLPPTRSLARAKRSLAGLAGGGGTPLAAGIDAAAALADSVRRGGRTPLVILLTDGRANLTRDGRPERARAEAEACAAARALRLAGCTALLVDTAPRPQPQAARLADAMGALYLPLPQADAATLSRAVRSVAPQRSPERAR